MVKLTCTACSPARLGLLVALLSGIFALPVSASWRSILYPENGYNPSAADLTREMVIQDFSFAGYRRGEQPIPEASWPVFNVTSAPYLADPTGANDSTTAIQSAINAAGAAGGGVVFLPAGIYRLSVPAEASQALLLNKSGVVLRGAGRGQTFLLNASVNIRDKAVIRVEGPFAGRFWPEELASTTRSLIRSDLLGPVREIPVESVAGFWPGDTVVVRNDITEDWITEQNETGWSGYGAALGGLAYRRTVVSVNAITNVLTVDVPIRYALKTRDAARVVRVAAPLTEVGLEDFSFANVQHPGTTWGDDDYLVSGTPGYEVHNSYFIRFGRVRDCWARRLSTYQPAVNSSTAHVLSGGMAIVESTHVTIEDCSFQRPQYGGGGGNGYMFLLLNSGELLLQRSTARFSRHGFSIAGIGASGMVLHECLDADTGRATGATGSYNTSGSGSDLHRHFSQAILFDRCTGENSWFEARYRPFGTAPLHNITGVHAVFWNTLGTGTRGGAVVRSEQARFGYVIGTRGNRSTVDRPRAAASRTDPIDHLEGEGLGDSLIPPSLFLDQRALRLGPDVILPAAPVLPHPADTFEIHPLGFTVAGLPAAASSIGITWSAPSGAILTPLQNGGVSVRVPGAGVWAVEATLRSGSHTRVRTLPITATPSSPLAIRILPAIADAHISGTPANITTNYGTSNTLQIKRAPTANTTRHGLLRFDLATLRQSGQTPVTARLMLNAQASLASYAGWQVAVRAIAPTPGWTETGVTWSNAPALGDTITTYLPSPGLVDTVDVSAPLLAAFQAGADHLDLALFVTSQPDVSILNYHSREQSDAALRPRLELDVIAPESRFENWISTQPGIAPEDRGSMDDPDADGLPNILEMALANDPARSDPIPPLAWIDGSLHLTLAENFPAFMRLRLEQSADLISWQPLGIEAAHIEDDGNGALRVTRPIALDPPRQFWRLRAEPE